MRLCGTHGDDPDIIASITMDDHKQATRSAHPECDETLLSRVRFIIGDLPALFCWSHSNPTTYCMHMLCIHQIPRAAERGMQAVT